MRKRIWRMSEDKFDNRKPKLDYEADCVVVTGVYGQKLSGTFQFKTQDALPIKGIVYSSNPYVRVVTPQFHGAECSISYEIRGNHYHEGDTISGYFTICYDGGVDRLPFDVLIKRPKLLSSYGEIQTLADFTELAKGHWTDAFQLFYSPLFEQFIETLDISVQLLYKGYKRAKATSANLEEFLVSAGQKPAIEFSVDEQSKAFYDVSENLKESIVLTKSAWGYIEISVTTDCDFITVEKERVTTDYFLGSTMTLNYYIHKDRLHAGKNYGVIQFECKGKIKKLQIMATTDGQDMTYVWQTRQINHEKILLTQEYEKYRFRQITTGEWCEKSVAILDDMLLFDKKNTWFRLLRAHCFIANGQNQEGLWIIQDLRREIRDKFSRQWAYLLYLCTLIEREEEYVNRLTDEIEEIFHYLDEDPVIFWILTFLRKDYVENHRKKLHDIAKWIKRYPSPFFISEAYSIVLQDPYLLEKFDDFSTWLLFWAAKKDLITRDIAMQINRMLEKETAFSEKVFYIATKALKVYETDQIFEHIISYLLRSQVYDKKYLHLYAEAIERDLRLSGLYEAYMMTLPNSSIDSLPYKLVLYFQYSCNLPYQKRALLYANIIIHRKEMPQLYEQYFRTIEEFALSEMKQNHIDDNLAIIYQNVLEMGVVDEAMASAVAGTIFTKKLICNSIDIIRVIVYQEQYEFPIVAPVEGRVAYLPIVSKHFQVFLETKWGTFLSSKHDYSLQRIMYPENYIQKLEDLSPLSLTYILSDFDRTSDTEELAVDDIAKITTFLSSSVVSKTYVESRYPAIIALLQKHTREELLDDYFKRKVNHDTLSQKIRDYILEQMLLHKEYERAYSYLSNYYGLAVSKDLLLEMCSELLLMRDFTKDEFLLSLCAYLAADGYATASTITYLSTNQVAQTEWMLTWWRRAKELQMYVKDLEESLLFQSLYTGEYLVEMMPVFESYLTRGNDKMLIEAYLNYFSHEYMLARGEVPEIFFTYLAYFMERHDDLKDSCNLAYMKYLSSVKLLTDKEYKIVDHLLQKYILRNIYFGFYRNLDTKLQIKYHLYDKFFVEYRGNPGDQIKISYQISDGDVCEDNLYEMYEGIFVKQFILFYGETLKYELYAIGVADLPVATDEIVPSSHPLDHRSDRYEMINRMQNALLFGEYDSLARDMKNYQGLNEVVGQLFTTV